MDADNDSILPDNSTTTPDESEGGTDLKHTVVEKSTAFIAASAGQ